MQKSYLIKLEADDSTIVLPSGRCSGNSRISLSENDIDKISQYQYSILEIKYYDEKMGSAPEKVLEFEQGELQHQPGEDVPEPETEDNKEEKSLDTNEEISDNESEDIIYCNNELSNGGKCKREVESDDETCWQH
jgi:hypothetical protein